MPYGNVLAFQLRPWSLSSQAAMAFSAHKRRLDNNDCDPDRVVGAVLRHLSVRDLFACVEVNEIWKRAAIGQLRERLNHVLCLSAVNAEDEASSRTSLCMEVDKFCTIARAAQKSPVLCFLVMAALRADESRVIQEVRQAVPTDCVVVVFKSLLQSTAFGRIRYALNACLLFNTVTPPPSLLGLLVPEAFAGSNDSFTNTAPGVFTFMSKINVPYLDGALTTSYYEEYMTGHKLQVTTTALPAAMNDQSEHGLLNLRSSLQDGKRAIVVVFQSRPADDTLIEGIRIIFSKFPILMAVDPVEEIPSTDEGMAAVPPVHGRVKVMAIKLILREAEVQEAPQEASMADHP